MIAAGGLAGKVTRVTGGTAEVTLITDSQSAVSAQVMPDGATGIVKPEVGDPNDLLLDFVQKGKRVTEGTTVVTSGFASDSVRSIFPRGIPIGRVTKVDLDEVELYQRVHIKPFADLRRIDFVQVLTRRGAPAQSASTGSRARCRRRDPRPGSLPARRAAPAGWPSLLQISVVGQIGILGGNADLTPLVVAAVAYYGGSVAGSATGFAAGVLLDLATGATMGASSLVLTAVGYGVGRYREVRDPSHGLLPVPGRRGRHGGLCRRPTPPSRSCSRSAPRSARS